MNAKQGIILLGLVSVLGISNSLSQTTQQHELESRLQMAQPFLKQKEPDRAIPELEAVIAIDPKNADSQGNLGVLLFFRGDYAEATPHLRAALERTVQREPTNATAHYRLSTLYREENRSEDAKRELDQFLKYKQMKEKLRSLYKEMQIQPDQIREDEDTEK